MIHENRGHVLGSKFGRWFIIACVQVTGRSWLRGIGDELKLKMEMSAASHAKQQQGRPGKSGGRMVPHEECHGR
jgi:hypothetical protein